MRFLGVLLGPLVVCAFAQAETITLPPIPPSSQLTPAQPGQLMQVKPKNRLIDGPADQDGISFMQDRVIPAMKVTPGFRGAGRLFQDYEEILGFSVYRGQHS